MKSYKPIPFAFLMVLCVGGTTPETADGQMFGRRSFGTPLTRQPNPGVGGDVGTLRNQRFIRGNRRRQDFVGVDRMEASSFVGLQDGGAQQLPQSAVTVAPQPSTQGAALNTPLPPAPRNQMYPPKIIVDFDYDRPSLALRAAELTENLRSISPEIEVSVEGRTAILRGAVPSAEHVRLATILASFQPGISAGERDLTIVGDRKADSRSTDPSQLPPPPIPEPALAPPAQPTNPNR